MSNVNLSRSGPSETVLAAPDPAAITALSEALDAPREARRDEVAGVVSSHPTLLQGWAALGDLGRDDIESYAAFRVGYHRGLDALRASGWRGSGYVRWSDEPNQGFLRSLQGLAEVAAAIGEQDEAQRCALFLNQLDPRTFPPPEG